MLGRKFMINVYITEKEWVKIIVTFLSYDPRKIIPNWIQLVEWKKIIKHIKFKKKSSDHQEQKKIFNYFQKELKKQKVQIQRIKNHDDIRFFKSNTRSPKLGAVLSHILQRPDFRLRHLNLTKPENTCGNKTKLLADM